MNWNDEIKNLRLPPLKRGAHSSPEAGVCAMEMVAFLERLPHSDAPECTCPVIAAYVRGINDMLPDGERNRLLPYLPRLVGTVAPQHQQARAEYLTWQAVRVFAPMALRAVGLYDHAAKLEAQTDLRDAAYAAADAAAAAAAADAAAAAAAAYAADAANATRAAADAAAAAASRAAAAADAADADAAAAAAAADAAAYATSRAAASTEIYDAALKALDGVLEIGAVTPRAWPREQVAKLEQLSTITA